MADIKIHVKLNFETGRRDIIIEYESEKDALPIEHEQRHQEIVRHLVDTGVLKEEEVGEIIVERITEKKEKEPESLKPKPPLHEEPNQMTS